MGFSSKAKLVRNRLRRKKRHWGRWKRRFRRKNFDWRINPCGCNCIKGNGQRKTGRETFGSGDERMKLATRSISAIVLVLIAIAIIPAQSRHSSRYGDLEGTIITVTAKRTDDKTDPIRVENLFLYENGFEQKSQNFSYDPSPSRILLLIDIQNRRCGH